MMQAPRALATFTKEWHAWSATRPDRYVFFVVPPPFSAVVLLAIIALFAPSGRGQTQAPSTAHDPEPRGTAGNPTVRHQSGHVSCARYP